MPLVVHSSPEEPSLHVRAVVDAAGRIDRFAAESRCASEYARRDMASTMSSFMSGRNWRKYGTQGHRPSYRDILTQLWSGFLCNVSDPRSLPRGIWSDLGRKSTTRTRSLDWVCLYDPHAYEHMTEPSDTSTALSRVYDAWYSGGATALWASGDDIPVLMSELADALRTAAGSAADFAGPRDGYVLESLGGWLKDMRSHASSLSSMVMADLADPSGKLRPKAVKSADRMLSLCEDPRAPRQLRRNDGTVWVELGRSRFPRTVDIATVFVLRHGEPPQSLGQLVDLALSASEVVYPTATAVRAGSARDALPGLAGSLDVAVGAVTHAMMENDRAISALPELAARPGLMRAFLWDCGDHSQRLASVPDVM